MNQQPELCILMRCKKTKKHTCIHTYINTLIGTLRFENVICLGETQKRAVEEGEQENHTKKKRRIGNETISFLREKAESEKAMREEELVIRRKQQEMEEKKLASYLDQQKSMMELMKHQQKQQSRILMAVVDKLMNKKS